MKFIVKKDSDTGKQLAELRKKCVEAENAALDFMKEMGATHLRPGAWCLSGGIYSLAFAEPQNSRLWRKVKDLKNEYYPKKNTKEGKALNHRIQDLPTVDGSELNKIVGVNAGHFNHVGWSYPDDSLYYGIDYSEKWGMPINPDMEEITVSRWNELFEKEEVKA